MTYCLSLVVVCLQTLKALLDSQGSRSRAKAVVPRRGDAHAQPAELGAPTLHGKGLARHARHPHAPFPRAPHFAARHPSPLKLGY